MLSALCKYSPCDDNVYYLYMDGRAWPPKNDGYDRWLDEPPPEDHRDRFLVLRD